MTPEQMEEIPGIGAEMVETIQEGRERLLRTISGAVRGGSRCQPKRRPREPEAVAETAAASDAPEAAGEEQSVTIELAEFHAGKESLAKVSSRSDKESDNHRKVSELDGGGHSVMKKIRINELARELEVKPNVILDLLPEFGVTEKKTHSSSIDEAVAVGDRRRLTGTESAPASAAAPKSAALPRTRSPEVKRSAMRLSRRPGRLSLRRSRITRRAR